MENAELYQSNNALQKRDAQICLEEFANTIKWKHYGDRVIDLGCADGSVTTSILKNFLPANFKKLVGCDISSKMVQYANQHYRDEETSFIILDIGGKVPDDCRGAFDHAFSFYAMHWVQDQEKAFNNIYDLLEEGGDCLLVFLGHMPVYDIVRALSKKPKWSSWLVDIDRYESPYHDCQDPKKTINNLMQKIGFKNIEIKVKGSTITYENADAVKKAVRAVNPYTFPEDVYEEFLEDYLQLVKEMRLIDEYNNNVDEQCKVKATYNLIVVYGSK